MREYRECNNSLYCSILTNDQMKCQFTGECGFYARYAGSKNPLYRGFVLRYCHGDECRFCERILHMDELVSEGLENMFPSGQLLPR